MVYGLVFLIPVLTSREFDRAPVDSYTNARAYLGSRMDEGGACWRTDRQTEELGEHGRRLVLAEGDARGDWGVVALSRATGGDKTLTMT